MGVLHACKADGVNIDFFFDYYLEERLSERYEKDDFVTSLIGRRAALHGLE